MLKYYIDLIIFYGEGNMKRLFIFALIMTALLFAAGCGDEKKENNWENQDKETTDEDSGNTGDTGNTGNTGNTGDTGNTGNTGNTGDTGDTGNTGDTATDEENDTEVEDEDIYVDPVKAKFIGTWAQKIILKSVSSTSLAKNVPSVTTRYIISKIKLNNNNDLEIDRLNGIMCRTDNRTGDSTLNKGVVGFNEPNSKFNTIYHFWKPNQIPGQENMLDAEASVVGDDIFFKTNKEWELRGANMADPSTESMPTKDNDTRIFDHDNDTKPGFTITFNGFINGSIHYVQRLTAIFEGKLVSEGKIEGNVEWTDEQYALSSSSAGLKDQKTTVTDKAKSVFQFVKVDDSMDCAALVANLNGANDIFDIADPNTDVPNN